MQIKICTPSINEKILPVHPDLAPALEIKRLSVNKEGSKNCETFIYPTNYEILIIKKGKGQFLFDAGKIDIVDNTVYLISPGQIYKMMLAEVICGYTISFTERSLSWCQNFHKPLFHSTYISSPLTFSTIRLENDLFENIEKIVLNMISEMSGFNPDKEELLNSFLKIIMIYLSRKSVNPSIEKAVISKASIVKRFFKLLYNDFKLYKSVAEFAGELSITPNYLSEVVKRETGYSAGYHIQQRIIMEAKNIALDPAVNMKTIAYNLGFEDVSHFSKFFKKYSGVNFSVYRREASF